MDERPLLQCREELIFYEEIFEFVIEDLRLIKEKGIIAEGAAYLPKLMKKLNVSKDRYDIYYTYRRISNFSL